MADKAMYSLSVVERAIPLSSLLHRVQYGIIHKMY